jgi:hypothetical protein
MPTEQLVSTCCFAGLSASIRMIRLAAGNVLKDPSSLAQAGSHGSVPRTADDD